MFSSKRMTGVAAACAALMSLAVPAVSPAAVKVNLRVEGAARTLFEKAVVARAQTMRSNIPPDRGTHPCNVVENGGSGGSAATPVSALVPTRLRLGLKWYAEYTGFLVDSIARENPPDPGYWDFFVNGKGAADLEYLGGCQLALKNGDSVVWTVTDGSEFLLSLKRSGSDQATGASLLVTNASTGQPVGGASVAGRLTGADGRVVVPLPARGSRPKAYKATAPGAIRSNAVRISAAR